MSSRPEQRAAWRFSLGLTAWFLVIFVLTAFGLTLLTSHLVKSAMNEEWETRQSEVTGTVTREGGRESRTVVVREREVSAAPSPEMQEAIANHFRRAFPLLLVPVIVVGLLGGLWVTWRATRPIRSVTETAQQILATGDSKRRVPLRRAEGAMGEMAALFNRLLDRNESLIRGVHASLDSVAHDLRTPMTRLRATAEQALESAADEETYREALAGTLEESQNVLNMLDTLMDVAEAESGAMRLDMADVDLTSLASSVVDLYELVADERDVTLTTDVEAGLAARGDGTRLRRVLANLVDNAIKYSDAEGVVAIEGRRDGAEAVVSVVDRGRGIDAGDLPHIWDRLYRGDRSRSEAGLGLGLSYVRAVVLAHGGRVDAQAREGGGSRFEIRLPVVG